MLTKIFATLLTLAIVAAACTGSDDSTSSLRTAPTTTPSTVGEPVEQIDGEGELVIPEEDLPPLELALIWHQHQPEYPEIEGTISRPWVRLHAAKDYVDMANIVEEFPDLRLTINLSPVLMGQLLALENGANDSYETLSRKPIEELSPNERRFIVERFFDINGQLIEQSDRYEALRTRRNTGGSFSDQDLRDLRTLFHLGWIDPEFVASDTTLRDLRSDDRGFTDEDTIAVLDAIDDLVTRVLPTHAELWDSGQIEVITSPLAHPILPLIADSDLAQVGDPDAILPRETFREYADAELHVERGLELATEVLGQTPNGMWPGEGAVAQAIMPIFAENDVAWVASGEDVLARSLGVAAFDRDTSGTVIEADALYQPYRVSSRQGEVAMFFRDVRLSDLIGFDYATLDPEQAADDMMDRLNDIRIQLARAGVDADSGRTPLVTLVIDGENPWENYRDDGREFLRELYGRLTTTEWLTTTTPTEFLQNHPNDVGELTEVFPASWFSPDFRPWIGEAEEARAWELLGTTRQDLRAAERRGTASPAQLARATDIMLSAQGSDWFWWYGTDQDSGDDRYFDSAYRELLGQVYDALGQARPRVISVPIIPDPRVVPVSSSGKPVTVRIDGNPADFDDATIFDFTGDGDVISRMAVAVDTQTVGFYFDGGYDDGIDLYLGAPAGSSRRGTTVDDRFVLGFDATHLVRWNESDGACLSTSLAPETVVDAFPEECDPIASALSASGLEMALPIEVLGSLGGGDTLNIRIQTGSSLTPSAGPAEVTVPDIAGFTEIRVLEDPSGDDHGPGTYTYPTDPVFTDGSFDLLRVVAGESGAGADGEYVFSFQFDAPILNPWNSPTGLSLQAIDLYLDYSPGGASGARFLLDGRNAQLPADSGWEAALAIEGWESAVVRPGRNGTYSENSNGLRLAVLAEQGLLTVRVAKSALPPGLDLETAGIAVAVLSQDDFPSPDVRRVRDVTPTASQYRIGGGNSASGDTRILDTLFATNGAQEADLNRNLIPIER